MSSHSGSESSVTMCGCIAAHALEALSLRPTSL